MARGESRGLRRPLRQDNSRGGDGLSHMALSVVGDMHQQTCNRSRHPPLSHAPSLFQIGNLKCPNPGGAFVERSI
jgi:hypothetical protein